VVNAGQPPQILLSPPFSKEEVPDDERAGNDLAEFQQTPNVQSTRLSHSSTVRRTGPGLDPGDLRRMLGVRRRIPPYTLSLPPIT
jgi:hypothetical protein